LKDYNRPERVHTLVIGGGQAGLSVGYQLAQRGVPFLILDANERIGHAWRNRWDSLRLFSPAGFDGLTGMKFPARGDSFPTKDEMADYLEAYAERFKLPVRTGVKVDGLTRQGRTYVVTTGERRFEAEHVVVAMAKYQAPHLPRFAGELDAATVQIHSVDYRNPGQLRRGGVLIVGAGNSGAEIALDVARAGHQTWLSGRDTGQIPFRIHGLAARLFLARLVFRVVFHRVLTVKTPMGRRFREKVRRQGGPLIRVKNADLAAMGIERVPKVRGVQNGSPVLEDGRVPDVTNVIWCTGFHDGFSWVKLPVFDSDGEPKQEYGVIPGEPGLYFTGLPFISAFSSTMIHGLERDAKRIAKTIESRSRMAPAEDGYPEVRLISDTRGYSGPKYDRSPRGEDALSEARHVAYAAASDTNDAQRAQESR
jgi:putative flavoprotein involved in K+ transport